MLKYQLKKGVKLETGMAFRYKSNEELEALISALGLPNDISNNAIKSSSSLKNSGILIFYLESPSFGAANENRLEKRFIIRKYLVERDERIMKKKDFFNKTEYDNGTKNNKGSVWKYNNASNIKEQTDVNKNSCHEHIGTPAEQDTFSDKLYIVGMETDRIKKLIASKFPLFEVKGVYNIGSECISVKVDSVHGFKCTLTIQKNEVVAIDFHFNDGDDRLVSIDVLKELIARYFNIEKQKPKEGIKFECVTDLNGDTRVLMTDYIGNKVTFI